MSKANWVKDTLTLSGKELGVRLGILKQAELSFYPENPRLYSIVQAGEKEPSQAYIQEKLGAMDHVKKLVQSIRANGGLTDPLIVQDGDFFVLEGNSRLAAYRILARNDPIRWGEVKVKLLPKEMDENLIFALLGEYHIIGKKDWLPYEEAGYLYRRNTQYQITPARMAEELGESQRKINHYIKVYSFMVKHSDNDVNRWSYYDDYVKNAHIKKARKEHPEMDEKVVSKIKSGEIQKAVDVREKVAVIAKAGEKVLNVFLSGNNNLEKCYERAIARGVNNTWYNRMHKFRAQVSDPDTKTDLMDMPESHRKKCIFELKKIERAVSLLLEKVT